ncbi:MAG: SIMPL domain-containing protein [Spirochaetaceae bacterium]|nr:SIMPL domain-containing protein [Spirochaetaceae bacterium]
MKKITLSLLVVFICAAAVFAQSASRTISVSGSGSVKVPADMAKLTFSVITKEPTALASVQNNAGKMNKVYDALKKIGIEEEKISTTNYSLYQESIYKDGKYEPGQYVTSNDIIVMLDDVEKAGLVIDTAIGAGVNQMKGISFLVKDSEAALNQARVLAFQQAKEKAELYAREASCKLGKVLTIMENSGSYPVVREYMGDGMLGAKASNATTISAGQDSVTATVSVVFELR